jgi:hypothetical protein
MTDSKTMLAEGHKNCGKQIGLSAAAATIQAAAADWDKTN